jgi:hypothetical protein
MKRVDADYFLIKDRELEALKLKPTSTQRALEQALFRAGVARGIEIVLAAALLVAVLLTCFAVKKQRAKTLEAETGRAGLEVRF